MSTPLCYTKESFDLQTAQALWQNTLARLGKDKRGSKPALAVEKEVEQARAELDAAVVAYCAANDARDVRLGVRRP